MKTALLYLSLLLLTTYCYSQNYEEEHIPEIEFSTFKFYNQNLGWLIGTKYYRWVNEFDILFGEVYSESFSYITHDGGRQWDSIQHDCEIRMMDFISETTGWAVDEKNVLLKTEDGGRTWIKQKEFRTNWAISTMHFSDQYHFLGAVVTGTPDSRGKIFISYDNGVNWIEKNVADGQIDWFAIEFWEKSSGAVFGYSSREGMVVYLTDSIGSIWVKKNLTDWNQISDIQLCSDSLGYYIGQAYNYPNWYTYLVKNTYGFEHSENIDKDLISFQAVSDSIIYSLHNGILKKTRDAGETWTETSIDTCCTKLYFADELNGILLATPNILYRTSDGGATWERSLISEFNVYKTTIQKHAADIRIFLNDNNLIEVRNVRTNYRYDIIDINGKEVLYGTIDKNEKIPVHNLTKGLYLIQLKNSNGIIIDKFIKR